MTGGEPIAAATRVARAIDELRRGQIVRVTSAGGDLDVLAVELADARTLDRLDEGEREIGRAHV